MPIGQMNMFTIYLPITTHTDWSIIQSWPNCETCSWKFVVKSKFSNWISYLVSQIVTKIHLFLKPIFSFFENKVLQLTSKLLQKEFIVNLLCVITTETPFNTFSFHNFEGVENTYYLHNKIEFRLRMLHALVLRQWVMLIHE